MRPEIAVVASEPFRYLPCHHNMRLPALTTTYPTDRCRAHDPHLIHTMWEMILHQLFTFHRWAPASMNNDSTPTPAAALLSNPSNILGESAQSTRPRNVLSPAQKRFQAQITKKLEFVDDLIKHSDMLIYMELCVLYYMEYGPPFMRVKPAERENWQVPQLLIL
jgi:hypothetical protein